MIHKCPKKINKIHLLEKDQVGLQIEKANHHSIQQKNLLNKLIYKKNILLKKKMIMDNNNRLVVGLVTRIKLMILHY